MSVIKFELKEDHIKLIKHLKWNTIAIPHIKNEVNPNTPFTDGESVIDDISLILHGHHKEHEILPDSEIHRPPLTEEQIAGMKKLYEELPVALDIICYFNDFTTGWFKSKSYVRDWKRIEKPNISE